jgi:hypothetical protein
MSSQEVDKPVDPKVMDQIMEQNILPKSVQNLFVGLNKGNLHGAYELKESGQLSQDIEFIATAIRFLTQNYEKLREKTSK